MEKKRESFTLITLVVISRFCRLEIDWLMLGSFRLLILVSNSSEGMSS